MYRPLEPARDDRRRLFYARPATPRRATELGLLALAEVARRRPGTRVVLFGDRTPPAGAVRLRVRGRDAAGSSWRELYNRATVGLVISLTNYSRMPKEMMACGLPVVDVEHPSVISVFGSGEEVIALSPSRTRLALADRIDALLDDRASAGRGRPLPRRASWPA